MQWSAQELSGCHIPRWHVVTGPSGCACCPKTNRPLPPRAVKGQGQSWDHSAETRHSKLSVGCEEASDDPDACAHYQVGSAVG